MKDRSEISKTLTPTEISVEPFIGKAEVARRMGRTVRAVEAMMRRRLIPFYKFDSRAAFRWSEIQSALAETCRVPALPRAEAAPALKETIFGGVAENNRRVACATQKVK